MFFRNSSKPVAVTISDEVILRLMNFGNARLKPAVQKIFDNHPALHRWINQDALFDESMLRTVKSCRVAETPDGLQLYCIGLDHLRCSVIDLYRQLIGQRGWAAHLKTDHKSIVHQEVQERLDAKSKFTGGPVTIHDWIDFHESVQLLDHKSRETFHLIYYGGLNPLEVALLVNESEVIISQRFNIAGEFFKLRMQQRYESGSKEPNTQ